MRPDEQPARAHDGRPRRRPYVRPAAPPPGVPPPAAPPPRHQVRPPRRTRPEPAQPPPAEPTLREPWPDDRWEEPPPPPRRRAQREPSRWGLGARGLTGSLTAGFTVLAVVLVGVQFWATSRGQTGPGISAVVSHAVAALVAIVLQATADRRAGASAAGYAFGAVAVVIGSLWFWWWA